MKRDEQANAPRTGRFPALQSPEFRLLWIGQTLSAVGTKMQDTTVRWHVYALTHSALALGLLGLCRFVPLVLFALPGGAVADAKDRRRILLITQTALAVGAALLACWTHAGTVTLLALYSVNALSAVALAFDSPARQALLPNLVPRPRYPNAVSLNATAYKVATVVGPCLAGSLLQRGSLALLYGINALSFLAVLFALIRLKPQTEERPAGARSPLNRAALRDGLRFVRSQPILLWTMSLDFLANIFASAEALLPIFARDILRVDAYGYGLLTAAPAVGSVVSGTMLSLRRPVVRQGLTMLLAVSVYGAATIVFGLSRLFWLSLAALAVSGAADTVSSILRHIVRQMATPDSLRGRMTAVNMIFFTGGPQLGNLEAGLVASVAGASWSVISGGIGCLLAVAWVAASAPVLRNYRRVETD